MKLYFNPTTMKVKTSSGKPLLPYQIHNEGGYRFEIVKDSSSFIAIRILLGHRVARRETVPALSPSAGTDRNGQMRRQSYLIDLDKRPVFPLLDLVGKIQDQGILRFHISPMFGGTLEDVGPASSTDIVSDGNVIRRETGTACSEFVVSRASWAIRFENRTVRHIYLWDSAFQKVSEVLDVIKAVRQGTVSVSYSQF